MKAIKQWLPFIIGASLIGAITAFANIPDNVVSKEAKLIVEKVFGLTMLTALGACIYYTLFIPKK